MRRKCQIFERCLSLPHANDKKYADCSKEMQFNKIESILVVVRLIAAFTAGLPICRDFTR